MERLLELYLKMYFNGTAQSETERRIAGAVRGSTGGGALGTPRHRRRYRDRQYAGHWSQGTTEAGWYTASLKLAMHAEGFDDWLSRLSLSDGRRVGAPMARVRIRNMKAVWFR